MQKIKHLIVLFCLIAASCNQSGKQTEAEPPPADTVIKTTPVIDTTNFGKLLDMPSDKALNTMSRGGSVELFLPPDYDNAAGRPGKHGGNPHTIPTPPPPPSPTPVPTPVPIPTPVPPSNPFEKDVLLVFSGTTVTDPAWEGGAPIVCAPTNVDSINMKMIQAYVQSTYALWRVRIFINPLEWAVSPGTKSKMIITPTSYLARNPKTPTGAPVASGLSYVGGGLGIGVSPVGFTYSDILYYNWKYVKKIIRHEIGHLLGLSHEAGIDANGNCIVYGHGFIMGEEFDIEGVFLMVGDYPGGCGQKANNDIPKLDANVGRW